MEKKILNLMIALCITMGLSLTSCSKDDDPIDPEVPEVPVDPNDPNDPQEPVELSEYFFVLNSGNMGNNNASLSMYDLKDGTVTKDIFETQNGRRLGDTGQDLVVYGSKMYIAVYGESTIEVTDLDAKSIRQIRTDGQPRSFAVHGGKVYVTYFNGYVARIDTASLDVEATVQVGRNPEQLTVVGDNLYVANSGGLDYSTEAGYDNTVSVVDIASFTETKKIEVIINPCEVVYDNNGSLYVVSLGNYGDVPNTLQKINTSNDEVSVLEDFNGTYLAGSENTLYTILSQYDADWNQIITYYSYDMVENKILSDNFIGDTQIATPHNINYDAGYDGLFVTSSDYMNDGDVYVFDKTNTFVTKFGVGLNPIKAVYLKK